MTEPIFLQTPNRVFEAAFDAISRASTEILFQCYKVQDDDLTQRFRQALMLKASKGVRVRVIYDRDSYVEPDWWQPLTEAGGRVHIFGRAGLTNQWAHEHTKCLVTDGEVICGGVNFQGNWREGWYDYDVQIKLSGPVVEDVRRHFDIALRDPCPGPVPAHPYDTVFALSSSIHGRRAVDRQLAELIDDAHHYILIASWLLIPSRCLHRAIMRAIKRGVAVTAIVAQPKGFETSTGWGKAVQEGWLAQRVYLRKLKEAGALVVTCTGAYWHGKALLIDDATAVFGSYNFNVVERATRTSNLSLVIRDSRIATAARMYHESVMYNKDFQTFTAPGRYDALHYAGVRAAMGLLDLL